MDLLFQKPLEEIIQDFGIPALKRYTSIDSTNTEGLRWIEVGAQEYSLVVADIQQAGRGRSGRKWITLPGASLACSLILYPTAQEIEFLPFFSPLGGLSVAAAIADLCVIQAQIKWPNDVLLNQRKTAGILAETYWLADQVKGLVLGIGINIAKDSLPPRDQLLFPATCIEDVCQIPVDRYELLRRIIAQVVNFRKSITKPTFLSQWQEHLAFKGQLVQIKDDESVLFQGKLVGIDNKGWLVLENKNERRCFPIGDLHLRPANAT